MSSGYDRPANARRTQRPVVVAVTGASGAVLARQAIARLLELGYPLRLVISQAGERVWREELGCEFGASYALDDAAVVSELNQGPSTPGLSNEIVRYPVEDIGAPIASGRLITQGMLVIPCSMDALSAFAHGRAGNLLERAADVTLKEGRPLVLVPRETPLSAVHLENMLSLARLGVRLVPPMPAFYLRPSTLDEIVAETVDRALRALQLPELIGEA